MSRVQTSIRSSSESFNLHEIESNIQNSVVRLL